MPVLKIKKTDGSWQEVWGALSSTSSYSMPRLATITISASGWSSSGNLYSQRITTNGVNVNSKLDLLPSSLQLAELQSAEITLMAANDDGTVVIYSLNGTPSTDMSMQMLITDVEVIS